MGEGCKPANGGWLNSASSQDALRHDIQLREQIGVALFGCGDQRIFQSAVAAGGAGAALGAKAGHYMLHQGARLIGIGEQHLHHLVHRHRFMIRVPAIKICHHGDCRVAKLRFAREFRFGHICHADHAAAPGAVKLTFCLGAELRAFGVDFSFAPVLDLDYGESSVIGDRAFARDTRVVSMLAQSVIHGLLQSGMASCGKHFPGHGLVKADSHLAIPVDRRSLKSILAEDAAPYRWLGGVLGGVMPAHVIYPKVDSRPAGFSQIWLQDVLRAKLGFGGAVFSDDLSMAAARVINGRALSYTDAALAALGAGCDMVLLCNQSGDGGAAVDELLDVLLESQTAGRWQANEDSEQRRVALLPQTQPLTWDQLMHDPAYQRALERLP